MTMHSSNTVTYHSKYFNIILPFTYDNVMNVKMCSGKGAHNYNVIL